MSAKRKIAAKPAPAKPPSVAPAGKVLLPYQRRLFETVAAYDLTVYEKSRRIGITWAIASAAVLTAARAKAAGGMDVLYLGYALDMTREFIDTCADFARAIEPAIASVSEFLFDDGSDKGVGAFRIAFASGFQIVALTSKPRSLRGRQGFVIIDEAAFHDELDEVLKAAMALTIWGGKVAVISSHNGAANPFAALIEDIRAGRRSGIVLRTTLDDALADGLYKRICYVQGKPWSADAERAWRDAIYKGYGEAAREELDVIPSQGSGAWLSRAVLEQRAIDVPVLRLARDAAFTMLPPEAREADIAAWLEEHVAPLLAKLHPHRACGFGLDFGREIDRSVLWPAQEDQGLVWTPPFLVEMHGVPFEQQRQVLFYILDFIGARLRAGALDAGGNGAYLAEVARQRYGECVQAIKLTEPWYREHMPKLKAGLDDGLFLIPKDADVVADLMQFKLVKGVARLPEGSSRVGSDGLGRHGDSGIAAALCRFAIETAPIEFGYVPAREATAPAGTLTMTARNDGDEPQSGFGRGAW
ncbi:MAG: hypothetical protein NBV67_00825 [Tagaea sp.]|nr:hypothetical protein [Tagaea sp.]